MFLLLLLIFAGGKRSSPRSHSSPAGELTTAAISNARLKPSAKSATANPPRVHSKPWAWRVGSVAKRLRNPGLGQALLVGSF